MHHDVEMGWGVGAESWRSQWLKGKSDLLICHKTEVTGKVVPSVTYLSPKTIPGESENK